MKDIKKVYDDIKISEREKNKIFNNIMENRKKRFNWGPIFGVGAVALASFGFFMIANKGGNNTILKPNEAVKRNVALENSYRKEIITGTKKYLEANKIDVSELEEGEELIIKGEDIVENEEYNVCKGNLVIKRYNDDFSYSTDVTCEGEDTDLSNAKEYVIYSGTLTDVFEIKYGIAVASISNVKKPDLQVLDCDANLIVMNNDGKIRFNKTIVSKYTDEDSTVVVKNVKQVNGKYYLLLEVANDIHFEPSGAGHLRNHYYLMVLDENGEELSYDELLDNGKPLYIDNFIGGDNYTVYYTGYSLDQTTFETVNEIIKVTEDGIETIPYTITEESGKKDVARNTVISGYEEKSFYGYKYDKSYAGSNYYSAKTLFKMNDKAEIVWETKLENFNINKVEVANEKVYVLGHNGSIARLFVFGRDGQKKGETDLGDFYNVSSYYVEGTRVIVKGSDKKGNEFFEIFDEQLEKIEKVEIDNSDIKENFEYSFMQYAKIEDGKVIAGYTVNKNLSLSDEVLLVFNK
ncbi:MAG: hypothetical protein II625_04600 [Bacilli bacterium]|nr:hypothetical protein [Bacilli bacterium]